MPFQGFSDSLQNVSDRTQDFISSTAEYYKLRLFKSSMKGAISLVNLLVFGSIFLFVLLFLSIGLAFLIGKWVESVSAGFFIVGGFYAIILICLFVFGKKMIEKEMLIKFSGILYDEDDLPPKKIAENELEEYSEAHQKETV